MRNIGRSIETVDQIKIDKTVTEQARRLSYQVYNLII